MSTRDRGISTAATNWSFGRGRGRAFSYGRGRNRSGRGRTSDYKSNVQCFHCRKFGHVKAECWESDKYTEKGASLVGEE